MQEIVRSREPDGDRVTDEPQDRGSAPGRTVIELCGSLRAQISGREVTFAAAGGQGRVLFAYLVLNRHRPVSRDELIGVLWPAEPPEDPAANLSTVLARLRNVVGAGVIEGRAQRRLLLHPDADIDVERAGERAAGAELALARGDVTAATAAAEEALEIVERPLLPGIDGEWLEGFRAGLAALEPGLLEVLANAALHRGQLANAERIAGTLVERHPFRESAYALLMQIQAGRGNVAEATLTFDRLRVLLRDELGTAPSPGVSAMHDQLLHGRLPDHALGAAPPARDAVAPQGRGVEQVPLPAIGVAGSSSVFVGREGHLDCLRAPWQLACGGQRRFALLEGEPGVGKTRLATRFAAEVHGAGATVLYGRCDEEPLLAYQPFVQALRHYLRYSDWESDPASVHELRQMSRLMPETRSDSPSAGESFARSPDSDRYLLFEAVARLLGRATRERPLLLVLDDLHWADKPTLLLLRHLVRGTDPGRVMVLGIFRDVEVDSDHPLIELVADLRAERRLDRLPVEGLDPRETDALITARLEAPPHARFVRGLRARTDGNPFFIEEALRSLLESGAVQTGATAPEEALVSMGVPAAASEVILRRVGRLSDPARRALTAASVIGREFDMRIAAQMLNMPADHVLEAMEEAMRAGLVGEVQDAVDRFMFVHALVRETVGAQLSKSRRLRLHLSAAEALEVAPAGAAPPEELAHHFFVAREVGGAAKAVRYATRAGEEAASSLAYEESAAHYRRALQALDLDPDEPRRCDVLLALGRVQWQAGDAAALDTYLAAADSARRLGDAERLAGAAVGLGERYWDVRAVDEQYRRLLAEALDALSTEDGKPRVQLMARMAENLHFTAEQEYGEPLSRDALAMARRLGDRDTLVRALMGRHVTLLHIEHLDERRQLIDEVLGLVKGHRPLMAEAHQWRLFDLWELGDVTQAQLDHARLDRLARDLRQPLLMHLAFGWEGTFAHLAGDVEKAELLARRSYAYASRARVSSAASTLASMLFTVRRQQGRIDELVPTMRSLEGGESASPAWKAALALAEIEIGEVRQGSERYERLAARDFAAIPRDWFWLLTSALLVETCVALGDEERAACLYRRLEPFADRYVQVIFTASWGSVQRFLGLLAGVLGRFEDAEHHFQAGMTGNERMGAVLMTAETQCAWGELLLRRGQDGDREQAATLGDRALQVAAPRGLDSLRRRAEALRQG